MENLRKKMDQTNVPVTLLGNYGSGGIAGESTNYLVLSDGSRFELSDGSYFALNAGTTTYGDYEAYNSAIYTATSIAFFAASGDDPAYLTDSQFRFGDQHIQSNTMIAIATTSGLNDTNYTIADRGVSRGEILLSSTDSLTTETAADAGTVIISKTIIKPNITNGCPFCGSLNSRS